MRRIVTLIAVFALLVVTAFSAVGAAPPEDSPPGLDVAAQKAAWQSVFGDGADYDAAFNYQVKFRDDFGLDDSPGKIHSVLGLQIAAERSGNPQVHEILDERLADFGLYLTDGEYAEMKRRDAVHENIGAVRSAVQSVVGGAGFGGLWIDQEDGGKIVVGISGPGNSAAALAAAKGIAGDDVKVVGSRFSYEQLEEWLNLIAAETGFTVAMKQSQSLLRVMVPAGETFVLPEGVDPNAVVEITAQLTDAHDPSYGNLIGGEKPSGIQFIYQDWVGSSGTACTTGFHFYKSGVYFTGTAAHCKGGASGLDHARLYKTSGDYIMYNSTSLVYNTARLDFMLMPSYGNYNISNYYHVQPPGHSSHSHTYQITSRQYLSQIAEDQGVCASVPADDPNYIQDGNDYECGVVTDYPVSSGGKYYQVISSVRASAGDSGSGSKWGQKAYGIITKQVLYWDQWGLSFHGSMYSPIYFVVSTSHWAGAGAALCTNYNCSSRIH